MGPTVTTILVLGLGLGVLAAGRVQPPVAGGPVGAVVPPWQEGGMVRAAATGLPVVDVRAGGRVLVLVAGSDDLAQLREGGLWLFDPGAVAACGGPVDAASGEMRGERGR